MECKSDKTGRLQVGSEPTADGVSMKRRDVGEGGGGGGVVEVEG